MITTGRVSRSVCFSEKLRLAPLLKLVLFPAAGQRQHLASGPGGPAARLHPALHAEQRPAASLPPRALRARRLVYRLHGLLLLLQRILGQSLHVLRPQVSEPRRLRSARLTLLFTHPFLLSVCRKVPGHEAETAGAIMAFFLSLGLALGAAVSFAFRAMI